VSIALIRATFDCDGCGKQFRVDVDPARRAWKRRQAMMELAEDAVRGGYTSDGETCSVQADMHLCEACTDVADGIRPDDDDYEPTAAEISAALDGQAPA
jgi:hypothetical protein